MEVELKNNAVEITTTIPLMQNDEGFNTCNPGKALDIVGSFSGYLIVLLTRRKDACMKLLRNHINDVFYNNGFTIAWHRKDGTTGYFNIPSYQVMEDAIKLLKDGKYKVFLEYTAMVDQTIKAIANDPELDHSDCGSFKFSELVSVLCEYHAMYEPNFQQEP